MNKKKIFIITTGGTIASANDGDGYRPMLSGEEMLSFLPQDISDCDIEVRELLNIDSSNIQPDHWLLMAREIIESAADCDGIVIPHGTDTMAYSAAAVSYLTMGCTVPVIFTGSQLPIAHEGSDGRRNLADAIRVASDGRLKGVYIVFNGRIINGCCATKASTVDMDAFQSINCDFVGSVGEEGIKLNWVPVRGDVPEAKFGLCDKVFLLKLIPGLAPEVFDVIEKMGYRAIIIESFGAGGIPILKRSLLPKLRQLCENGVLTVVTTQCFSGGCDMSIYEVGRKAEDAGAICAGNMTREALVAKLMWALYRSEDYDTLRKILLTNYCGELGENKGA